VALEWCPNRGEEEIMKLVDSKMIARAEGIFYNAMSSVIDIATIGELFRTHFNLRLSGEAQFQDMDVVVQNDQIAFKFDYTATAYFSIFMDRSGAFLELEEPPNQPKDLVTDAEPVKSLIENKIIVNRISQLADTIADSIERETLSRLIEVKSHAKLHGRLDFMGARFAARQNQPVYNLIYQGEIALSFLVDEKGQFLDFAEAKTDSFDADRESKLANYKDHAEIDDFIVADEKQEFSLTDEPEKLKTMELEDETELELIDDEELESLGSLILGKMEDSAKKSASN
jgi:hypothetical protein